jgi:hypothetical protein
MILSSRIWVFSVQNLLLCSSLYRVPGMGMPRTDGGELLRKSLLLLKGCQKWFSLAYTTSLLLPMETAKVPLSNHIFFCLASLCSIYLCQTLMALEWQKSLFLFKFVSVLPPGFLVLLPHWCVQCCSTCKDFSVPSQPSFWFFFWYHFIVSIATHVLTWLFFLFSFLHLILYLLIVKRLRRDCLILAFGDISCYRFLSCIVEKAVER